jgi:Type II secretion system (T2SS), protein M subtype b
MKFIPKLLGLLIVTIVSLTFGIVAFGLWTRDSLKQEELAVLTDSFERMRDIAAFDTAEIGKTGRSRQFDDISLGQGTPSILTAKLQSNLRELASKRGVEIIQTGDLSPEELDGGLKRLGVRLEMSGPAEGIFGVLLEIERASPWLFLDNVQVRSGFVDGFQQPAEPPMFVGTDVWGIVTADKTAVAP